MDMMKLHNKKQLIIYISIISMILIIAVICLLHYQKRDGFREIRKGNFSVINGIEESDRSALETVWQEQKEEDDMEWVLFDLNEDGVEELIWREKELPEKALRRIVAVFSKNGESVWLVLLDTTDDTEYYVLENGNYIYYQQYSEPYRYLSFKSCYMSENFELIGYRQLEAFLIPAYDLGQGKAEEKWAEDLEEQYSFISGEGSYFRAIDTQSQMEILLSKGDWTGRVERMTDALLEDIDPELYSLIFTGDAIITEKEINPYSPETIKGFYMHDIFEANRGAYIGFDRCADEGFEYHREFNPWQGENPYTNLTWDIQLVKMKESEALADVFNEYHEKLFEEKKADMERLQEKAKNEFRKPEDINRSHYSSNMRTMECFYWGDFFSVVDIGDTFYSASVNAVTANFNTSSGKQYRLSDLFAEENYKEYLMRIIWEENEEWGGWVEDWRELLEGEESETSFLITYKGLMLIDNRYRQEVLLIEWEKIEDILSREEEFDNIFPDPNKLVGNCETNVKLNTQ